MRVPIKKGRYLTLVNVYASTVTYSVEKETFYQDLTQMLKELKVRIEEKLQILGNLNALVGTDWGT